MQWKQSRFASTAAHTPRNEGMIRGGDALPKSLSSTPQHGEMEKVEGRANFPFQLENRIFFSFFSTLAALIAADLFNYCTSFQNSPIVILVIASKSGFLLRLSKINHILKSHKTFTDGFLFNEKHFSLLIFNMLWLVFIRKHQFHSGEYDLSVVNLFLQQLHLQWLPSLPHKKESIVILLALPMVKPPAHTAAVSLFLSKQSLITVCTDVCPQTMPGFIHIVFLEYKLPPSLGLICLSCMNSEIAACHCGKDVSLT